MPQPALAARGHEFGLEVGWGVSDGQPEAEICTEKCKPGIAGSGKGQLALPVAVAVNEASGDVYVLDESNGRVERFSASGHYLGEFDGSGSFETEVEGEVQLIKEEGGGPPSGPLAEPKAIAVDNSCVQAKLAEPACKALDPSNGDVYVADGFPSGHKVIDKFTAFGEYVGQVPVPLVEGAPSLLLGGLAVDGHGNLWVCEEQGLFHRGFDKFDDAVANAHLSFVQDAGLPVRYGLAVGPEEDLYSQVRSLELPFDVTERYSSAGHALEAMEQEPSSGVAVEWSSGDVYVDNRTSVRRFTSDSPSGEVETFGAKGELVGGLGLAVNAVVVKGVSEREGPVYVADGSAADVVVFPLEGPKQPTIDDVSVSNATSESALLRAVLNPRGSPTEYIFKYGRCSSSGACASSPFEATVSGSVGSPLDFETHEVVVPPQDLKPGSTYHFHVLARNSKNEPEEFVESAEIIFATQSAATVERPVDGRGWEMVSPSQKHGTRVRQVFQEDVIQAAADGDAFTYVTASPTEDEPAGFSNEAQVLARRTGGGWVSEDIGLGHQRATGQTIGEGLEYRFFSDDLSVGLVQPFGEFEPATSAEATEQTPYIRSDFSGTDVDVPCTTRCYRPLVSESNVQIGARFGEEGVCPKEHFVCGPRVLGSSADGRHVILGSPVGLTEGSKGGLYEWNDGVLTLVSVLPNGSPASNARDLGGDGVRRGAVSNDGSRVVWSEPGGKGLYLRDVVNEDTVQVNKGLAGTPTFQAADADGSRVFFTEEGDLYVFEAGQASAVRLTTPLEAEDRTLVQGKIAGISEDGTIAYFVASGRLSNEVEEGKTTCGASGSHELDRCYMYEVRDVGGVWQQPRLVAALSSADIPDFAGELPGLTSRVSPDGRWLTFMSKGELTGYDNRDAVSGARDEEVFLFESTSDRVVCVSCDPSGARPDGIEYRRLQGGLVAGDRMWPSSTWLAGVVPGWTPYKSGLAFHQPRFLLDDGRVFFDSSDGLVAGDTNGTEDVYEFEPVGVAGCTTSSPGFVETEGGCVGLVSSGTSREESAFLDASVSGSDVFFLTASTLVSSDFDSALDVYDAHECSAAAPCTTPPAPVAEPCVTEASCMAPPRPQPAVFGLPASGTFTGIGNVMTLPEPPRHVLSKKQLLEKALTACKRQHAHSRKRRITCQRRARAKYARGRAQRR